MATRELRFGCVTVKILSDYLWRWRNITASDENTEMRLVAFIHNDVVKMIHDQTRHLKTEPDLQEAKSGPAWTRLMDLQDLYKLASPEAFTKQGKFVAVDSLIAEGYKVVSKWIEQDISSFDTEIGRKSKKPKTENKNSDKILECVCCKEKPATKAYSTCGHFGCCDTCAEKTASEDPQFSDDEEDEDMHHHMRKFRFKCPVCRLFSPTMKPIKIASKLELRSQEDVANE